MRQHQTGFSLIEMLAVVFVVVLLTSLVSLNVGSGSSEINRENKVREVACTSRLCADRGGA
jgi:prepilin-type N-terminal cleavage/methylation domain-containing protein